MSTLHQLSSSIPNLVELMDYLEDAALRRGIREGKLDLPVNASRTDKSRVQRLDLVSCHNHLNFVESL